MPPCCALRVKPNHLLTTAHHKTEVSNTIMSSVQYSAFTRLLTQNNRVHDMEEMLRQMWVPSDWLASDDADAGVSWIPNPFAELQNDIDRESRACLVSCWAALPVGRGEGGLFV